MQKLSKFCAVMLCVVLLLVNIVPAGAEEQQETKTKSVDVMLVVDDTVSMQRNDPNRIASVALQSFVEKIPREGSRIGMATYDDDILTSTSSITGSSLAMVEVVEAADKEPLLEYARNGLTQDGRFTDLPSALYYAMNQIQSLSARDNTPAIIAVSDGENDFINNEARNLSGMRLEEVFNAGIPVYLIVIHASDRTDVTDYMQGIADRTNGRAYFANSGDEIDDILDSIVNVVYGYVPDPNSLSVEVDEEPVDWGFHLASNIFEATVELSHEMELDTELFGPDEGQILLDGNSNVTVSSVQSGNRIKTYIRLLEPDEGDYVLRLTSPRGAQAVLGEIVYNHEIYVQVDLDPNPAEPSDTVKVSASLMRDNQPYTDIAFANLDAEISIDGNQPDVMERGEDAFLYDLTVEQESTLEIIVTVRGQKSFVRSSDPVTLQVGCLTTSSSGSSTSGSGSTSGSDPVPDPSIPIWMIILATVLLIVIIVIVIYLITHPPDGNDRNRDYIQLRGTLTVRYYADGHQFIWEKFTSPGRAFSKRTPYEPLGRLLRESNQDYGDIPPYFDNIQIAGVQYSDGRLCVEVIGSFETSSGPTKISQYIDIDNGNGWDDGSGMSFSGGDISSANIVFEDNTEVELEFSL